MTANSSMQIMQTPDRYAVIGNPIAHSKSPLIHASFARQTGQAMHYEALFAPLDGFVVTVQDFIARGARGANVTLPFKQEAYRLTNTLTSRAQAAGAVNTLQFKDGAIEGDNTDGIGLVRDITQNAGWSIKGSKILLLGAGGAARGVILPLLQQKPAQLVVMNRTHAKAEELAHLFAAEGPIQAWATDTLQEPFDIVVNATSASLATQMPDMPAAVIARHTCAYDMMYGPGKTPFLQFSAQHGALVRDGLGMLIEQAAEAFFIWRGIRPDTAPVFVEFSRSP